MQVVRLCSQRAQVSIAPAVEHLTLHYQVANIKVPGHEQLQKLHAQKHDKVCPVPLLYIAVRLLARKKAPYEQEWNCMSTAS